MTVPAVDAPSLVAAEESGAEVTLRAALDVSPDGFAVHRVRRDRDGRAVGFTLEVINAAGAAPHAAGPDDVVGRDLTELLPDPEATGIPAAFRVAADTGVVQQLRTTFDSDDWSGTTDLLVARVDSERIVATWRDVSDLVRSEQILVEAYTRAQSAWDCLYGVLDAVEDAVLLLRVAGEHTSAGLVVKYLNAAAAGARDRTVLIGRGLLDVRPDLALDCVVDLVAAAATDRPGCVRRLVMTGVDGVEIASFTASPGPPTIPVDGEDITRDLDSSDGSGRSVVLVVRQPVEPT